MEINLLALGMAYQQFHLIIISIAAVNHCIMDMLHCDFVHVHLPVHDCFQCVRLKSILCIGPNESYLRKNIPDMGCGWCDSLQASISMGLIQTVAL